MSTDSLPTPYAASSLTDENGLLREEFHPNLDHIVTEDETPVDGQFSEKQHRLLIESLYSSWKPNVPFVAMTNVGLFYAIRKSPFVPDALISLGVSMPQDLSLKKNRSYFVWEYGKPPDVVVEVVSNREGGEDSEKLVGYASIGIKYYIIYDPEQLLSKDALRVYELNGLKYRLVANTTYLLTEVGFGVTLWDGVVEDLETTWMRWIHNDGNLMKTGFEMAMSARKDHFDAALKASEAEIKANEAELKASEAMLRADALAEQLRSLGIKPNV